MRMACSLAQWRWRKIVKDKFNLHTLEKKWRLKYFGGPVSLILVEVNTRPCQFLAKNMTLARDFEHYVLAILLTLAVTWLASELIKKKHRKQDCYLNSASRQQTSTGGIESDSLWKGLGMQPSTPCVLTY